MLIVGLSVGAILTIGRRMPPPEVRIAPHPGLPDVPLDERIRVELRQLGFTELGWFVSEMRGSQNLSYVAHSSDGQVAAVVDMSEDQIVTLQTLFPNGAIVLTVSGRRVPNVETSTRIQQNVEGGLAEAVLDHQDAVREMVEAHGQPFAVDNAETFLESRETANALRIADEIGSARRRVWFNALLPTAMNLLVGIATVVLHLLTVPDVTNYRLLPNAPLAVFVAVATVAAPVATAYWVERNKIEETP
ncbi:MAG: hypothetical protein ACFB51_04910 [Anaerolineae bacterium]